MYPSEMKNINQLKRNLSPELEEIRDRHISGTDKYLRIYGGLSSDLISFDNQIIELEVRFSEKWTKPLEETALQLATSWKKNSILLEAKGYLVHLFKRENNPGVAARYPNSQTENQKEDFCNEFIAALKAAADNTNDQYLESIKGVFELHSDD